MKTYIGNERVLNHVFNAFLTQTVIDLKSIVIKTKEFLLYGISEFLLFTAKLIMKIGGFKFSNISRKCSADDMGAEWNYSIRRIPCPIERCYAAFVLVPDSITMTGKFGYIGRWMDSLENKIFPKDVHDDECRCTKCK